MDMRNGEPEGFLLKVSLNQIPFISFQIAIGKNYIVLVINQHFIALCRSYPNMVASLIFKEFLKSR